MGVGLIIAAVTIGATVATTLFAKGPRSTKGADMAPANLDAFRLTTAEEGTVIPRVFGTVRLPGNLLYYGNLSSEPEYEETTKRRALSTTIGYYICASSTLLWNPFSPSCQRCTKKEVCLERTRLNYPELYRLRIEEFNKKK